MMTIYGARSAAEAMIARVRRMHDLVAGTTPSGEVYRANDPELLNWVQGTAAYSFLQAYHVYVQPLSLMERDRYYAEAVPVGAPLRRDKHTNIGSRARNAVSCDSRTGWSPLTLCLSFCQSCARRLFYPCYSDPRSTLLVTGCCGSGASLGADDLGA